VRDCGVHVRLHASVQIRVGWSFLGHALGLAHAVNIICTLTYLIHMCTTHVSTHLTALVTNRHTHIYQTPDSTGEPRPECPPFAIDMFARVAFLRACSQPHAVSSAR